MSKKYTVCLKENEKNVGHLKKQKNERFAKNIIYFVGAGIPFHLMASLLKKRSTLVKEKDHGFFAS